MGTGNEFIGLRSKLFTEALTEYPYARKEDIEVMYKYLSPQPGEYILGFGEGNGYFCQAIAEAVGSQGSYLITDPSQDQLDSLLNQVLPPQVQVQTIGAEGLEVPSELYEKVWSFGAFHHCPDQTSAMQRIYKALKPGGKAVICDVFQGTSLARHFDVQAGRYCETGHEVKFLSEDFARTLCFLAGFEDEKVNIIDLPQKWYFGSEYDIGVFVYKIYAMTKLPGTEQEKIMHTLNVCKEMLGIEHQDGWCILNWPMKAIVAQK